MKIVLLGTALFDPPTYLISFPLFSLIPHSYISTIYFFAEAAAILEFLLSTYLPFVERTSILFYELLARVEYYTILYYIVQYTSYGYDIVLASLSPSPPPLNRLSMQNIYIYIITRIRSPYYIILNHILSYKKMIAAVIHPLVGGWWFAHNI